jgi:hypothetical protein
MDTWKVTGKQTSDTTIELKIVLQKGTLKGDTDTDLFADCLQALLNCCDVNECMSGTGSGDFINGGILVKPECLEKLGGHDAINHCFSKGLGIFPTNP